MTDLRSILFSLLFYTWTTLLCFTGIWILPLPRPVVLAYARFWLRGVVTLEKNILGLTYRVVGVEHVPAGGCLIAAKHQSAWETFKLHLLFANPIFVLKQELTWIPLWGWYLLRSGVVPINRKAGARALRAMIKSARTHAEAGHQIVIFPQGTRTLVSEKRPYKPGIIALYETLNVPVIPMALNSGLFWPKHGLKRGGVVTVEFLPPLNPGLPRNEFMQQLETALETASARLGQNPG